MMTACYMWVLLYDIFNWLYCFLSFLFCPLLVTYCKFSGLLLRNETHTHTHTQTNTHKHKDTQTHTQPHTYRHTQRHANARTRTHTYKYNSPHTYILVVIFLFLPSLPFPKLRLYFVSLRNIYSVPSPSGVTNVTKTSLSFTTLTHSDALQFPI
jgi:hypothetical protein